MTNRFVLRDVGRIMLPFGIFMGLFSHGSVSAAGFALGVFCIACEIKYGLGKRVPSASGAEGA